MDFSERLKRYIDQVGCSAKELSGASGVSAAAISRYRTGERQPDGESEQVRLIAQGLVKLSDGKLDEAEVTADLVEAASGIAVSYDSFLANLNLLVGACGVRNNALSQALNFDASHISRILAGQRRPANLRTFISGVAAFFAPMVVEAQTRPAVVDAVGEDWAAIADEHKRAQAIASWLSTHEPAPAADIGGFLEKLDSFDLDDFMQAIHFDQLKVPTAPAQLPTTKTYTGLSQMMQAELDYLRATVMSRSRADVIMFSDMPMEEMAADKEFPRKWMFGMALLMKKGLRLHVIHNTARPLPEMMLGLESWIPLYMTGLVMPYYYPKILNSVFCHFLKVSGTAALWGEAIAGYQAEGRYIMTKNRDEVRYYRRRAERMLEHARPLMRVFPEGKQMEFARFERKDSSLPGPRRVIMSTLPIGTIPQDLLDNMVGRSGLSQTMRERVMNYAGERTRLFETMLAAGSILLEVPDAGRQEFAEHPASLELPVRDDMVPIAYTYDEYQQHLAALRAQAEQDSALTLVTNGRPAFRNITIMIRSGANAVVSKAKAPAIHFVIEQPDLVAAFESFSAPVFE